MTFEENNYKKNLYLKITILYSQKKYKEIIKEAEQYLSCFPTDINVRFMYSKSLRYEDRFEESIENFKILLNIEPNNEYAVLALYYLYYFLKMYDEAYKLLPQVSKMEIMQKQSLEIMKIVMNKGYNKNNLDPNSYIYKQLTNYNEEVAISHIKEHLNPYEEQKGKKGVSQFNDIDVSYLYNIVRDNLINNKNIEKVNSEEVLDVYYFGVSNIGLDDQNFLNYIKVVVIPNTFNIISIYPILEVGNKDIHHLEYDHDKLFKTKDKVKTYSRIEKFNKKYNISSNT